jgi:hypothetical protein
MLKQLDHFCFDRRWTFPKRLYRAAKELGAIDLIGLALMLGVIFLLAGYHFDGSFTVGVFLGFYVLWTISKALIYSIEEFILRHIPDTELLEKSYQALQDAKNYLLDQDPTLAHNPSLASETITMAIKTIEENSWASEAEFKNLKEE